MELEYLILFLYVTNQFPNYFHRKFPVFGPQQAIKIDLLVLLGQSILISFILIKFLVHSRKLNFYFRIIFGKMT